jgi:hypothetical protein
MSAAEDCVSWQRTKKATSAATPPRENRNSWRNPALLVRTFISPTLIANSFDRKDFLFEARLHDSSRAMADELAASSAASG